MTTIEIQTSNGQTSLCGGRPGKSRTRAIGRIARSSGRCSGSATVSRGVAEATMATSELRATRVAAMIVGSGPAELPAPAIDAAPGAARALRAASPVRNDRGEGFVFTVLVATTLAGVWDAVAGLAGGAPHWEQFVGMLSRILQ